MSAEAGDADIMTRDSGAKQAMHMSPQHPSAAA
jgi:hypothetical protein